MAGSKNERGGRMSKLIDADKLEPDTEWDDYYDEFMSYSLCQIKNAPIVKAVPIYKLKNLVDKLQDEKDYAYANFDEYKIDILGCDDVDELPNDDYRFGLNRAIALLQVLIAESGVNNE